MLKRVFLFLLTNFMVIVTISIVMSLFGVDIYLSEHGINYQSLLIFCALWGMGGAFVSLYISKWIAKRSMGLKMIDPQNARGTEKHLLDLVYNLARKAKLTKMPEVGIYQSQEINAFATGPSKKDSLVAVSSGLLQKMDIDEVEGVLGHEISHVTNGDMVTMTLIQGTVNAFALFLSRVIAYAVSIGLSRGEGVNNARPGVLYYVLTIVFDIAFTLLGSIVVAAFSRYREYRADIGGARLAGKNKMIAALKQLLLATNTELENVNETAEVERSPAIAALKISQKSRWLGLFTTHPPLEDRIKRLQEMRGI